RTVDVGPAAAEKIETWYRREIVGHLRFGRAAVEDDVGDPDKPSLQEQLKRDLGRIGVNTELANEHMKLVFVRIDGGFEREPAFQLRSYFGVDDLGCGLLGRPLTIFKDGPNQLDLETLGRR